MTDPTSLPNLPPLGGDQPAPEQPLRDRVLAALTELELTPTVDDDGDVMFVFQDQQMFIRASEDEAQILRVFGQWRLQAPVPDDRAARLEVCNDVNIAFNMIKTALSDQTLLVTSEHLLPRGADVRGLLQVAVPLVLHAVGLWHQRAVGEDLETIGQTGEPGPRQPSGPGAAFGLNGNNPTDDPPSA